MLAEVRTPLTTPRWMTNQRLVTVAAKVSASEPVPSPTSSPQPIINPQGEVMTVVSAVPAAMSASAPATTRRRPNWSISAAANGAVSP